MNYKIQDSIYSIDISFIDGTCYTSADDTGLISRLYLVLSRCTIEQFKQLKKDNPVNYELFLDLIKSKRKDEDEISSMAYNVIFRDFEFYSEDIEIITDLEFGKFLKCDINDYIKKPFESLIDYIESNTVRYMHTYETMHDKIILMLERLRYIDLSIHEECMDEWDEIDKTIVVDWPRLERDTRQKYIDGEVSIYGIRLCRSNYCRRKKMTTYNMFFFHPLRDVLERKYYVRTCPDTYSTKEDILLDISEDYSTSHID